MPADTKLPLLDQLRGSGLLQPAQLEELAALPEAQDPDPRALGRQVVQRKWLTPFQVRMVAFGRAGELYIGPYVLLDRLGEGGMGQVFKAQHQRLGRVVALKMIRKEKLRHPQAVRRFYQEAQAAGKLRHPNIVLAYDADEAGGTHFLSMEYVEGQNLAHLVAERGPLPVAQACDYVRQAALGLQHAHENGLVHRDIKPHNLLVTTAPPAEQAAAGQGPAWGTVKLLDLGLARITQVVSEQERGLTRDGAVLGTPDYLAPEQALDSRSVDGRSDLYSLGCTLYYLLTGRTPFEAESLTRLLLKHQMEEPAPLESLRPDVPPGVAAIVCKLLAKKPEDRIQTPAELAAALEPFCDPHGTIPAEVLPVAAPPAAEDENTWAAIVTDGETARGSTPSTDDRTTAEPTPPPRKGPRREAGKGKRPEPISGGSALLIGAIAASVVLPLALVLVLGAVLWHRLSREPQPELPITSSQPRPGPGNRGNEGAAVIPPPSTQPAQRPALPPPPPVQPPAPPPLAANELRRLDGAPLPVIALAFSPDGQWVAGCDGVRASLWNVADGRLLRRVAEGSQAGQVLAFTPDGKRLFLSGVGKVLQLWDAESGTLIRDFAGNTTTIHALAVSPDGGRVFAATGDLELQDGKPVIKDGRAVFRDCAVHAWDVNTGRELYRFEGHAESVSQVSVSADGKRALSRSPLRLCLWDADTGREVRKLDEANRLAARVTSAALLPDGRQALLGVADQGLVLWDVDADREVRRFPGPVGRVTALAVSADGTRALTGSNAYDTGPPPKARDCAVSLWDVADGRLLHRFDGHTEPVYGVALSPDGRLAASSSLDRTVRLWHLAVAGPVAVRPPAGTGTTPKPERRPPAPVVKKAAVPGEKEQASVLALIRKEFKTDYARKPADRGPLAQELLRKAADTNDDPSGRFVLLREARDLAELAGDVRTALDAIDRLDRQYDVDALDMKVTALTTAARMATSPAVSHTLAESALPVIDELVAAEAYAKAVRLATLADTLARRTGQAVLVGLADARLKEVKEARQDFETTDAARATLKDRPDDPEANLAVGKYLCFRKGDWDAGLPLLVKGSDEALAGLAKRDVAAPAAAAEQCKLGDAWWDLAEEKPALGKTQLQRRAAYWYEQALPGLTGLTQDRAADRIKVVQDAASALGLPETFRELRRFDGHGAKVTAVAFLPDGQRVVSGSTDRTARLWEVATGKELRKFTPTSGEVSSLAVSPDGAELLLAGPSPQAQIVELNGGPGRSLGQAPGTAVVSTAFAEGHGALLGNTSGTAILWPKTGPIENMGTGKWGTVWGLAASADGRHVLLGTADGIVHRWDLDLKREEGQLVGHAGAVLAVALGRDKVHALTGGADRTARLWDLTTGREVRRFRGHGGKVLSVALSADGKFAVTGGDDHTVRVWDTHSGAEVRRFTGHTAAVTGVAFSPDGRLVLSGSEDRTVRLWELAK